MVVNGPQSDWSLKDVFTTGEAAEVCRVSQQTIIRCFDSGRLTGFKVPGSRFRRIPRDELIRFMRANNIPTEAIESTPVIRVLIAASDGKLVDAARGALDADAGIRGRCEIVAAGDALEAGILSVSRNPAMVVLGDLTGVNMQAAVERLVALPSAPQILCVPGTMSDAQATLLRGAGAAQVVASDRREHLSSALVMLVRAKLSENGK